MVGIANCEKISPMEKIQAFFASCWQKRFVPGQVLLRPFLVNPSSGQSLAHLDGVRALAVLFVLIFHAWILSGGPTIQVGQSDVTPIIGEGAIGVQLFFVLSGFLLAQYWLKPYVRKLPPPKLRQYFRQRAFRLMPAYYCCLALMLLFFVPTLIPYQSLYSLYGAWQVGMHLIFLQYFLPVSSAGFNIDGALWTLTMEMLFYLILPLVVRAFTWRRWPFALLLSFIISFGWLYETRHGLTWLVTWYEHDTPFVSNLPEPAARTYLSLQFPMHAANFALGISLASIYVHWQTTERKSRVLSWLTSWQAGLISFALGVEILWQLWHGLLQTTREVYYFMQVLAACAFTLILAGILFGPRWLRSVFGWTPLRWVGIISYSIYLWHLPLISLFLLNPGLAALSPAVRFPALLFEVSAVLAVFASAMYLLVEKPFLIWGRR